MSLEQPPACEAIWEVPGPCACSWNSLATGLELNAGYSAVQSCIVAVEGGQCAEDMFWV